MKLMIKLTDLDEKPCSEYYRYIYKHYPNNQEFDAIELINKISDCKYGDVSWLIVRCRLAQTGEMLEHYKGLNPNYIDVGGLIVNCKFAQTIEMLEYYKSLDPDHENVSSLISDCGLAQTEEMLEYYKSLTPDCKDVSWLISDNEFLQTNEMLEYYKSLKPDYKDVSWLIENCEFAQTKETLNYYKSLNPDHEDASWLINNCDFAKDNWESARKSDVKRLDLKITVSPENDIPAFAAYVNNSVNDDKPEIVLNFKATLFSCSENGISYRQFFAESVVHEMLHMVQDIFDQVFDEDEVENAIMHASRYLEQEQNEGEK